jgi:hypothetical protein
MSLAPPKRGEPFRDLATRLVPPFAEFEKVCFGVGVRLGDAVPGLNELAQTFGAVADLLEGPQMSAAARDLSVIAQDLARTATLVEHEGRALQELVTLNEGIGPQVQALQAFVRTVAALVFTLKIESAILPAQSGEMIAFAKTLQGLAEQARDSLDAYHSTQMRLDATLRASAAAQAEFQGRHQQALAAIAADMLGGLEALAERRARTLASLLEIGGLSREIGARTGECVVSLQIGDCTRQRVEHAAVGLELAADALDGAAGFAASGERLAARAAHLQTLQLAQARRDFERETETIAQSLAALSAQAQTLEDRGRRLFGAQESGDGSFLEALAKQLSAARLLVEEGLKAREGVDAAKDAAAATMAELETRTANLVETAADVTMIGTNASLRSSRLGDAGKGITLVAAELRGFGREIRVAVSQLATALSRIVAFVDQFARAQRELDAERIAALVQRMQAAIEVFGGGGARMSEALRRLSEVAAGAREKLDRAGEALAAQSGVGPELAQGELEVASLVGALGGPGPASLDIDLWLDERLRPAYSMADERRVHDAFTGIAHAPEPERVEAAADAFML